MTKFYTLTVKDITKETTDSVSIAFDIPASIKDIFQYLQGQYITFKLQINGKEIRRSYSVCSSPITDSDIRVAVKKVKDGIGSTYLNDKLKVGDKLEVMPPLGNFHTPMSANNKKNYVLFAGGSGITPMLSIIKTVLKAEPNSTVQLFYGNQDEASIIFKNQLSELENNSNEKLKVYHILNDPKPNTPFILQGMLTIEKNLALFENYIGSNKYNEFFICGPTPMMQAVEQTLEKLKINKNNIHLEYFLAPVDDKQTTEETGKYKRATLKIILDGDEIVTELAPDETVLEAGIRLNLDVPFACQGGSCCTCRALLVEGKVEMKVNYALLDAEVKQGFILTCQSHALTNELVVDYDRGK